MTAIRSGHRARYEKGAAARNNVRLPLIYVSSISGT